MITHADGTSTPLIDASVHIFFPSNKALRKTLREPFKSRGFPDYEMDWYGAPGGEYAPNTEGPDRQYPGRIRISLPPNSLRSAGSTWRSCIRWAVASCRTGI
ncbi:amidohydrolase domain protein [Mycobacterium intracellulare 1956]|uniref:Amidohydrolase domain protein n=1 Tax=Mycobacterium intracellulare 1956 TaxID=1299331 RepID=X8CQE9_MYCIT|nr:amidohydrolase domain protein [Mycobacterium intracellulare 1956]